MAPPSSARDGSVKHIKVNHFGAMQWSPDGSCLAFTDGLELKTTLPNRSLILPKLKSTYTSRPSYQQIRWRPDGKQLLVYGSDKVVLVDIGKWAVQKILNRDRWHWWFANELATYMPPKSDPAPSSYPNAWYANGVAHPLPKGLWLKAVEPRGTAFLLADNEQFDLWLLTVDQRKGTKTSLVKLRNPGRSETDYELTVGWNSKVKIAAFIIDVSFGGTFVSVVRSKSKEAIVGLTPSGDVWWSECYWIDDRYLAVHFTYPYVSGSNVDEISLGVYDVRSGRTRAIYGSKDAIKIEAGKQYVAILEGAQSKRIVISKWKRDAKGNLVGLKYSTPTSRRSVLVKRYPGCKLTFSSKSNKPY